MKHCLHTPEAVVVGVGDGPEDALHGLYPPSVGYSGSLGDGDNFGVHADVRGAHDQGLGKVTHVTSKEIGACGRHPGARCTD